MSDAMNQNGPGFETEDLSPQGVFYFMAGLAIVGVLIYFIVVGMYRFLDAYDRSHQAPMNPMAVKTGADPRTMSTGEVREQVEKTFPKPVLEYSERAQFGDYLAKQDLTLESYDWVDQKNGVVRIPIERAMDLIAERGLPVLPPGVGAAQAETKPAPRTEMKTKPGSKVEAPKG
jgi:hypothetical protein